jgi:hypothetical protein
VRLGSAVATARLRGRPHRPQLHPLRCPRQLPHQRRRPWHQRSQRCRRRAHQRSRPCRRPGHHRVLPQPRWHRPVQPRPPRPMHRLRHQRQLHLLSGPPQARQLAPVRRRARPPPPGQRVHRPLDRQHPKSAPPTRARPMAPWRASIFVWRPQTAPPSALPFARRVPPTRPAARDSSVSTRSAGTTTCLHSTRWKPCSFAGWISRPTTRATSCCGRPPSATSTDVSTRLRPGLRATARVGGWDLGAPTTSTSVQHSVSRAMETGSVRTWRVHIRARRARAGSLATGAQNHSPRPRRRLHKHRMVRLCRPPHRRCLQPV